MQLSAVLRDLRPGTLYSLTLYGLRGPHQADSVQGTARTLSPGEPGPGGWCVCRAAECRAAQLWPGLASGGPGREGRPRTGAHPMPSPSLLGTSRPQFWRAPGTYSSATSGRPQPRSAGRPHRPEPTASKCPTSWWTEVTPLPMSALVSCPLRPPLCPPCSPPGIPQPPEPTVFPGEPQSVLVGGRARTQQLGGLVPGAHYEVTVVSVRGFEESEPLTGFLTTGERRAARLPGGRAAQEAMAGVG